jgi:hypothetical protein
MRCGCLQLSLFSGFPANCHLAATAFELHNSLSAVAGKVTVSVVSLIRQGAAERSNTTTRCHWLKSKIHSVAVTQSAGSTSGSVPGGAFAASGICPRNRSWEWKVRSAEGGRHRNVRGLLRTGGRVQHGSTATCADLEGHARTLWDGDLRLCTAVDGLPADGMQEVRSSNLRSSTRSRAYFECSAGDWTCPSGGFEGQFRGQPVRRRAC